MATPCCLACALTSSSPRLFQGTLRVLLVLLHDFPEFLCDYHYGFCDVIPPNCIQLRNLILSAFPRNMRLPDPFTPNLKVELGPCPLLGAQSGVALMSGLCFRAGAGGHAERDQHSSSDPHQLHRRHALAVQEGPGLVPEDSLTGDLLVGAA